MTRLRVSVAALVVPTVLSVTVLASCGSTGGTLAASNTLLGRVVADSSGRTLYAYTPDQPGAVGCVADCTHDWPPLVAAGTSSVGSGLDSRLLTTITRPDGRRQIAYAGHPLYRWVGDRAAGDIRGQAIGGVWFVIRTDGHLIEQPSPLRRTFTGHAPTTLTVITTRLGTIVADASGAPLYAYRDDTATSSACVSIWCPTDWVPEPPGGHLSPAPGINAAMATLDRPDGLVQVTLGGHPLYRFTADLHPGDLRGQGIGHDWSAVRPDGQIVGDGRS